MRYPIVFIILALLMAFMPLQRPKTEHRSAKPALHYLMSARQQNATLHWLDGATQDLRARPPLHQLLLMATAVILFVNAAIVLSYLINSVAAIAGIGVSLAVLMALLLLSGFAGVFGWSAPRQRLQAYMKKHAEFGPFVSKLQTRLWKKRFRRAALEHGFARQF